MKIEELIEKYTKWWEDLVEKRTKNEEAGYTWVTKGLEYDKKLELEEMYKFFDRQEQNKEYVKRYKEAGKDKKPHAPYQAEINMLQSFNKSFAMRHKTRLKYYRDDLSQKGAHAISAVNISMARFLANREIAEKGNAQE